MGALNTPEDDLDDGAGALWPIHKLPTDTALLRRIARNTDTIRLLLWWTLVLVPVIMLVLGIIAIVALHASAPVAPTGFGGN